MHGGVYMSMLLSQFVPPSSLSCPPIYVSILGICVSISSAAQSSPTLCDPMNRSTPGVPVYHQLPEPTQTHVHRVNDAIQPSHPLSSPSPLALSLSQHQDLFQWVSSSHQVAKVLEFQLQHQSFQWTPRTELFRMDWLDLLAVQVTLKSLLQHHSSKASILVYGVRKWSSFILLQVIDQFSQHHLLKRLSLLHCIFLPPLSKIRCPYVCRFIPGLSILFHWSICLSLCQYHTVLMTVAL